jgi:hypothetical protein
MADSLYFIRQENGPVKIGRGGNVAERLRSLQCGSAEHLSLLSHFPNAGRFERRVHSALQEYRVREKGEWFLDHEAVLRLASAPDFAALASMLPEQVRPRLPTIDTDRDKADLERAAQMVKDGKALRQRVLSRVRQRNWRERDAKRRIGQDG